MIYILCVCVCVCVCVYVCVCVWKPASTACPNYEMVGLQSQAVDITNLGSAYPHCLFNPPPMPKMHGRNETNQTKERQWSHYYVL